MSLNATARFRVFLFIGIALNLVIFPLNHLVGIAVNQGHYTPFSVDPHVSALVFDETHAYSPGPSKFFHFGRVSQEPDAFELRNQQNSYPVFHTVVLGLLAKGLGSLEWAWMVSHALFPTAIWALLFWQAFRISGSAVLAMSTAWVVCLVAFSPRNFLLMGAHRFIQPLELTRTPYPALAFVVLLLAIWLFARALSLPGRWRVVAAGVASGALFYAYYFYSVAFFAGIGSLAIVFTLLGRWDLVRKAVSVVAVGCLTATPYFFWTIRGMFGGNQASLMARQGAFTRRPDIAGLALALVLAAGLRFYCKRRSRPPDGDGTHYFMASLLAVVVGGAIGVNLHLLTGFDVQHSMHFGNRVIQPLLAYFLLLAMAQALSLGKRLRRLSLAAGTACAVFLVCLAALRQIEVGRNTAAYHRTTSPEMNVLLWLRPRIGPDTVIGSSDPTIIDLIPGITGAWSFVPAGGRSTASDEEVLTRYEMLSRMEEKGWPDVEAQLRVDPASEAGYVAPVYALLMKQSATPETLASARTIWNNLDLEAAFRARKLDYWVTERRDDGRLPTAAGRLEPVYENSKWRVFRIVK